MSARSSRTASSAPGAEHAGSHRRHRRRDRRRVQRLEADAGAPPPAGVDRARRARGTPPGARRVSRSFTEAAHRARRGCGLLGLRGQRRRASAPEVKNPRTAALAALLSLLPMTLLARTVRDDAGEAVAISDATCRIVSLAPGTTAMLYAARAGRCLVGTIAHSKEPAEAANIPVIGDAETLDFEQLLALRPTVVVVAVDVVQRMRIDRLKELGLPVYQVHVTSLAGMPQSMRRLGALTATQPEATRTAAALDAELARIAATYRARR